MRATSKVRSPHRRLARQQGNQHRVLRLLVRAATTHMRGEAKPFLVISVLEM